MNDRTLNRTTTVSAELPLKILPRRCGICYRIPDIRHAALRLHTQEFVHVDKLPLEASLARPGFSGVFWTYIVDGRPHRAWTSCFPPSAVFRTIGPIWPGFI